MLVVSKSMRQSQLFTKTQHEVPAHEVAKNAQLLLQSGYIYKNMAGVYTFFAAWHPGY